MTVKKKQRGEVVTLFKSKRKPGEKSIDENLDEVISGLVSQIKELHQALAFQMSHSAGRDAQMEKVRALHPDSPLFAESGQTFTDGEPKTQDRLTYEEAFDKQARAVGIDPLKVRRN